MQAGSPATVTFAIPAGSWVSGFWSLTANWPTGSSGGIQTTSDAVGYTNHQGAETEVVNLSSLQMNDVLAAQGGNLTVTVNWQYPVPPPAGVTLFTLTLAGCSYSISPLEGDYSAAGGSGTVAVTTSSGCAWTAVSNNAWITVTGGASGTGSGTVAYTVAANAGAGRIGTITIAGQTFTVSQVGTGCTYGISPSAMAFSPAPGAGSFALTTQAGCSWLVAASDSWITLTSPLTGSGSATICYMVAENYGSDMARAGTITVAGLVYSITQAAGTGSGDAVAPGTPNLCILTITRPNLRDAIRRKLGVTPPIDVIPGAIAGEEPLGEVWPGNALVNQGIADALRLMNRHCGWHSLTNVSIPVIASAASVIGPQFFSLAGHVGSPTQNTIYDVRRVVWDDGTGSPFRLTPKSFYDLDRQAVAFDQVGAGTPQYFFVEGYQLAVYPAPTVNGSLLLYAGTGLIGFCSDIDTLDELPVDYQAVIEDIAVVLLRLMRPDMPNAKEQITTYTPLMTQGLDQLTKWASRVNAVQQPSLIIDSRRRRRWL